MAVLLDVDIAADKGATVDNSIAAGIEVVAGRVVKEAFAAGQASLKQYRSSYKTWFRKGPLLYN